MSITAVFWEHINFGGYSSTSSLPNRDRYYWNTYGKHNDIFSSIQAWTDGERGNVYAFENINFDGAFAALNVGGAISSSWWSYLGDSFNDKVSSSLIVSREPQDTETEVPLRNYVAPQFASIFDTKTQGKPVSRNGDTRVYGTFFPSFDPGQVFATIDQALTVQVRIPIKTTILGIEIDLGDVRWSDYAARVQYHVSFFVSEGRLHGRVAWVTVWVEPGILHADVFNDLQPSLLEAASDVTSAIESALILFARRQFTDVYLLPGPPPDMESFGFMARYDDDVTLVVVAA